MEYTLAIGNAPDSIPAGSSILLVHPSTAETDRIDVEFVDADDAPMLIVSTRTTAREVVQKLEHYGVDPEKAVILDTLSAERGYTRRQSDHVRYIPSPGDLDSVVEETRTFLEETDGPARVSVDSITEMIYYADEERTRRAVEALLALVEDHGAVALFHIAGGVHDDEVVESFESLFEGVLELDEDGNVTASF
ncbi:hypothetical protein BRD08_07955 [Halobacteriales archaeon SW_10_66_29]|jgi:KaiC/GvpD/RAD55 family RecA-like ATPase|nr:MAG: hypothetical protein BRC73_01315 [Halobacteriales archaeon QH_7_66_37]PSQ35079.1 MAG: hypothetical protein BRD08_07955 [Halobacteriales archaeon SW_10_66_29]